jgi:hypothetical protein
MGNKAVEYRRQATSCFEVARLISLRDDRRRLLEMAEQLLALAKEADAEERRSPHPHPQRAASAQG